MIEDATPHEMEQCLDAIRDPAVQKVFIGWLNILRAGYLESLLGNGEEEFRHKVNMIDEVLDFEVDLYDYWKSEKNSA